MGLSVTVASTVSLGETVRFSALFTDAGGTPLVPDGGVVAKIIDDRGKLIESPAISQVNPTDAPAFYAGSAVVAAARGYADGRTYHCIITATSLAIDTVVASSFRVDGYRSVATRLPDQPVGRTQM